MDWPAFTLLLTFMVLLSSSSKFSLAGKNLEPSHLKSSI
jgi:hypothetical protein